MLFVQNTPNTEINNLKSVICFINALTSNIQSEISNIKSLKSNLKAILIIIGSLFIYFPMGSTLAIETAATVNSKKTSKPISSYKQETSESEEKIQSFKSFIKIESDGSLRVTETILVISNQKQIVHGLYRDFPTVYHNNYNIPFRVVSLNRDGQSESFHLSSLKNGVRIYFGNIHTILSSGKHKYILEYYTNHQLGFFDKYDELYWNVTGNDWKFPIDLMTAEIELPKGAHIVQSAAYTGFQGQRGNNFKSYINDQGNIIFETTKHLAPKEGLTISIAWPKGFINPDTSFFTTKDPSDRNNVYTAGIFLIILLIYSLLIRWRQRKFTHAGVIIPLFEPPTNISPSVANYLYFKGNQKLLQKNGLTAALLDLAVKGYLKIKESSHIFSFTKTSSSNQNYQKYTEEEILANGLFSEGETFNFGRISSNSPFAKQLRTTYTLYLESLYHQCVGFLQKNYKSVIFGFVIAFIGIKIISSSSMINHIMLYIIALFLPLSILFFRQYFILLILGTIIYIFISYSAEKIININDIWKQDFLLFDFNIIMTIILGSLLLIVAMTNLSLLKTYTIAGRKRVDEIEGFKLFLSVTETDRYKMLQAPEVTTEIFEKYLPFAVALGVETAWAKALSKEFSPLWYEGDRIDKFRNSSTFPSNVTAFSSALTLATLDAVAASQVTSSGSSPGSSSGSGGGGSSGGGGGGW